MNVACAKLFFSVTMNHIKYPCVLIHWYSLVGDSPDENMGMHQEIEEELTILDIA